MKKLLAIFVLSLAAFAGTPTIGVLPDNGPSLPSICNVGQLFFKTSSSGGAIGLYGCYSANTWTATSAHDVSPGGSDTQVQFNDGGAFGGDSALMWDKTKNLLTITTPDNGDDESIALLASSVSNNAATGDYTATTIDATATIASLSGGEATALKAKAFAGTAADGPTIAGIAVELWDTGNANDDGTYTGISIDNIASGLNPPTAYVVTGLQVGALGFGGTPLIKYGIDINSVAGGSTVSAAIHITDQGTGAADFALASDGGRVRLDNTPAPTNANDPCVKGEIAWDTTNIFICVATNTWKRAAIATW